MLSGMHTWNCKLQGVSKGDIVSVYAYEDEAATTSNYIPTHSICGPLCLGGKLGFGEYSIFAFVKNKNVYVPVRRDTAGRMPAFCVLADDEAVFIVLAASREEAERRLLN